MSSNTTRSILIGLLITIGILALGIGPINIIDHPNAGFILSFRGTRIMTALVVGALLSAAGASLQGALQNPLADPYILGISSGAGLGATLAIAILPTQLGVLGMPLAALAGAICSTLILMVGVRWIGRYSPSYFTLVGIAINALFSALTMLAMVLAGPKMNWVITWLMGDFNQSNGVQLAMTATVGILGMGVLIHQGPALDALSLGDDIAESFGFNPEKTRQLVIFTGAILTGLAVASAGIIGFVALVIPHITRLFGSRNHRGLVQNSGLLGAIVLIGCDFIIRVLLPDQGFPVGIMCALIGAPLFFMLLWKTRHDD